MKPQRARVTLLSAATAAVFTALSVVQAPAALALADLPPGVMRATLQPDGRTLITWDAAAPIWAAGTTQWWVSPSGPICENHLPLSYTENVVAQPSCIVSGLAAGQTVTVYIGEWEPTYGELKVGRNIAVVAPTQVPLAPVVTAATAGNTTASVSWNPPANAAEAGSALTYTVQMTPGGVVCTTPETACDVGGLTNGQPYTFSVTASGPGGASPAAVSGPVTPQASVPSSVRAVKVKRTGRDVAVTWQAPKSTGGSPITGYVVTASPGGKICKALKPLRCTIKALTVGTTYTFTVEAKNGKGMGPTTTSAKVTVPKPPPPPKHSVSVS